MKGILVYGLIVSLSLCLHECKAPDKSTIPSLSETYQKDDKGPFGGYVAYSRIMEQSDDRYIETINEPFDIAYKNMPDADSSHSLFFLISKNLMTTKDEAAAIYNYVSEGNDMCIAADYISKNLLLKLNCSTERDSEIVAEVNGNMKLTDLSILGKQHSKYSYYYFPFFNSFSDYDSSTKVFGLNDLNKPNYIVLFIGQGRVYLNAAPRAFSNYFLLKDKNYQYLETLVSFFRPNPRHIYWDEFYKKLDTRRKRSASQQGNGRDQNDRTNNFTSLSVINKNPALHTAFWIVIIGLLIYVLFNLKRKQRTIAEQQPLTNATVGFTETVGRLYLQQRDNKNIAEKMITYFYEHIRNHYFLNTTKIDNEFLTALIRKSNLPAEEVHQLFNIIMEIQSKDQLQDQELIDLNQLIQHFYKVKK